MKTPASFRISALALAVASAPALASETGKSPVEGYSPYAGEYSPKNVYFGDTHVHTEYSFDAGLLANTLGPDEAYRFARGEQVVSSSGQLVRLIRPLDFLVIADHAQNLGIAPAIRDRSPVITESEFGRKLIKLTDAGLVRQAYGALAMAAYRGKNPFGTSEALIRPAWETITSAADQFDDPGKFTALIGYEWTSAPGGNNLHRVVVFRDGQSKAGQVLPFSRDDSQDPEDLWQWMADYEKNTGGQILAIPHNGNLSNGLMFDDVTLAGEPLTKEYAITRMQWEPLYEVTQMKGDGETHPVLSPSDEFADFENWDRGSFGQAPKTDQMLPREYARATLGRGLAFDESLGANPFKFGLIGSTDSHTSLATSREENFYGKTSMFEPTSGDIRHKEPVTGRSGDKSVQMTARETSASGLAAVWAEANTREAIWDAMARKEVYATTGTRMRVRVFGGWDFEPEDLKRPDMARYAYANGVPMGSDLPAVEDTGSPSLLIQAMADPDGAFLDRVQVVKVWLDTDGNRQEKVFDAVWSNPERRVREADGHVPPVGNTVNVEQASYSNSVGAPILATHWQDPEFNPEQHALYYVRVLEIPTPRWTTYDASRLGTARPDDVPASIQERAYTSAIWYAPAR